MSDSWPEIRRKDRRLTDEESREVLRLGEYGILGTVTSKGNPYAVPLSYLYLNGRIYFHCATVGHKLESLKNNAQSCFTVVRNTLPVYDNSYSTYYESVMAFGPTSEVVDKEKKYEVLYGLAEKYLPDHLEPAEETINKMIDRTGVYEIIVSHFTGKSKKRPKVS